MADLARARRFVDDHPKDPRCEVFHRKDGYRTVSRVYPDPDSDTGWLCPQCGEPTEVFYGHGPPFKDGRYSGEDRRRCLRCHGDRPKGER